MTHDHRGIDLEDLISRSTDLRRYGRTLRGCCPIHHGNDRTALSIYEGTRGWVWHCHSCGAGGDGLAWVMALEGCDFVTAKDRLNLALTTPREAPAPPEPLPDVAPPNEQWQAQAEALVTRCADLLWQPVGAKDLAYLHRRGFTDTTIRQAGLGYNPRDCYPLRADWGLPPGVKKDGSPSYRLAIPRGIVIPWRCAGELWKVNLRTDSGSPKYQTLTGSTDLPLGIDGVTTSKPCLIAEGPLDALAVSQVAADLVSAVAVGATGCRRIRWAAKIAMAPAALVALDADQAGDTGAAWWLETLGAMAGRLRPWGCKDPGAVLETLGADTLRHWVMAGLQTEVTV